MRRLYKKTSVKTDLGWDSNPRSNYRASVASDYHCVFGKDALLPKTMVHTLDSSCRSWVQIPPEVGFY